MNKRLDNIIMEEARLVFTNFAGVETEWNTAGNRNFAVVIPTVEEAQMLKELGWNVKIKEPTEEGGDYFCTLSVSIGDPAPRIIMMVYGQERETATQLTTDMLDILDSAEIVHADLEINPYHWNIKTGASGVKAYLNKMYVVIKQDNFAAKYGLDY